MLGGGRPGLPTAAGGPEPDEEDEDLSVGEEAAEAAAFEREYADDHSWEELQEDEHGNLRPLDQSRALRARRAQRLTAAAGARVRRGMIRYLVLVVDLSRAAALTDLRPLRAAVLSGVAQRFIRAFFDENPLSQLSVVVLRDGVATRLTELSSSPEVHVSRLRSNLDTSGDASLQNGLDMAVDALSAVPPYGHREVLILLAALATCDPGNIMDSVRAAKQRRARVSLVGLAAEVRICRTVAEETGGTYGVALHEGHLGQLVLEHAVPPPAAPGSSGVSLVRMGFPSKAAEAPGAATFVGHEARLAAGGFACPRCRAQSAQLPAECHVCGLTLVSSPHLARSYHHLFPVAPFEEVAPRELATASGCEGRVADLPPADAGPGPYCFGCTQPLSQHQALGGGATSAVATRCPGCRHLFCFDCDSFIHEQLHNCPGCERLPPQLEGGGGVGGKPAAPADGYG